MSVIAPEIGVLAAAPPFSAETLGALRRLLGPAGFVVLDVRGVVRNSTQPLHARYAGTGANFRFLADLLFASVAVQDSRVRCAPSALRALARSRDVDVVLTDLPPVWAWANQLTADIHVPAWVRQRITLELDPGKRLIPRAVESEARRHSRREELFVDFARGSVQMLRFYEEFYRPYVRDRFGPQAVVVDEASFLAEAEHKVLARVFAHGEWTAGMLLEQRERVMRFGWFGARSVPAQRGASEVLDVACIRRAARLGMRYVVMGNSRPSLSNGVLRYKARFGAAIGGTRFPQHSLGISIRRPSAALVERLQQERLITIRRGRPWINRVEAHDDGARVTLARLDEP